jgi:hypothetical protein
MLRRSDRQRPSIPGASREPDQEWFRDPDAEWLWSSTTGHRQALYSLPVVRSALLGGITRECLRHLLGEMVLVHRELAVLVRATGRADRSRSRSLKSVAYGVALDLGRLEADLAVVCSRTGSSPISSAAAEATALLLTTFRQTAETVGPAGLCATLVVCRAVLCAMSRRLAMATQIRWRTSEPDGLTYWLALDNAIRPKDSAIGLQEALPKPVLACLAREATLAQAKVIYAMMGLTLSHALAFEDFAAVPCDDATA